MSNRNLDDVMWQGHDTKQGLKYFLIRLSSYSKGGLK